MTLSEHHDELDTLRQHSKMLGQIAGEVSDWCNDSRCTTLNAVRYMKADLLRLQADRLEQLADDETNNSYAP